MFFSHCHEVFRVPKQAYELQCPYDFVLCFLFQTLPCSLVSSVNPKLLSLLIPLILFVPPVLLAKLIAATATLLLVTPPWDLRASFIFAAVATSCFLFTYCLMCVFIGAIFLSRMSFSACCSEKIVSIEMYPSSWTSACNSKQQGCIVIASAIVWAKKHFWNECLLFLKSLYPTELFEEN